MAKNCLNKLTGNILNGCDFWQNGIKDIYLMYPQDVSFTFANDGAIRTVTFVEGAKSYKIEGYKQSIQITTTSKALDATNKLNASVSFKINPNTSRVRSFLMGRFIVMEVPYSGVSKIFGIQSPLECSAFDWDSNANGRLATVTLSDPDGSAGNYMDDVEPTAINQIISKSV